MQSVSLGLPCRRLPTAMGIGLLLALAWLAGCGQPQTPTVATPQPAQQADATADDRTNIVAAPKETRFDLPSSTGRAAGKRPMAGPELPPTPTELVTETATDDKVIEETWDAYSLQGSRVGYAHTTIALVEEGGQTLRRTRGQTRMTLKRAGQTVVQEIHLTSWDTKSGELVRFESRMKTGPGEMISTGRVAGTNLVIETQTLGKVQAQSLPWPSGAGGLFAVEQSLKGQPLLPGQKRTVKGLMAVLNTLATTELVAGDHETVKLPAGEQKLLKVESVTDLGVQKLETIQWVNEKGDTLKSLVPALGQQALRTTKEDALAPPEAGDFDVLVASVVKLPRPLANPLATKKVVYRAKVKSGKIDALFANCLSQRVKIMGERTAELTVLAVRPEVVGTLRVPRGDVGTQSVPITSPADGDVASSNFIQCDDPRIIEMASKVSADSENSWALAVSLEKHVAQSIKKKNFSQAFATAAEVAQSLEGDCTEHAVLLAALCRAREIPARVAFGLVYYPPQQGFAYHMWNEVWTGDRWVALDGTLGQGGIGADHIKLGDSDLAGTSALAAMLPVAHVFGGLELEVISAE